DPVPKGLMNNLKPVLKKMGANNYMKVKVNLIPDQDDSSSNCGYFASRFLIDRLRGKTFAEASGYDKKGEARIEQWKKTLPDFKYFSPLQKGEGFSDILKGAWNIAKKVGKAIITTKPRENWSPSIRK